MMCLAHKIGLAFLALTLTFTGGFIQGQKYGREAALKAAVAAYQTRGQINHETDNLNPAALCLALGGLPEQCTGLMRGLDKATQN